ncbi:hypothetical protein SPHINGOT1_270139 [Sphingomonas sp. T1]|nr:hypothetical protein SPHINGOT1_270139 [Sphingomonas sp. T1]
MTANISVPADVPKVASSHTFDRPVSPSLTVNFRKEQSGTDFEKTATLLPSGVPCDRQPS